MKFFHSSFGRTLRLYLFGILTVLFLLFLVQLLEIVWYGTISFKIKETAYPFSTLTDHSPRALILGDSTAVGVGVDSPLDSIGGRLALDGWSVLNRAEVGAYTNELISQAAPFSDDYFDAILVFAGGNDVLWFKNLTQTSHNISELLDFIEPMSDNIILLPPGNIGLAPMFREPFGIFYSRRMNFIRQDLIRLASDKEVAYLDLFTDKLSDLFISEPSNLFAADLIHPGSAGYGLWYKKLTPLLLR